MRRFHHLILVLLLTSFVLPTLGQESEPPKKEEVPPLLVVTDLRAVGGGSSVAEANAFSEFIREEVVQTLKYRMITRSSMMSIVEHNNFKLPCHELICFTRLGHLLGADLVLAGYLQRQGEFLEVTLRLIDVNNAKIQKTVYHAMPNLTSEELLGDWGQSLIYELFEIDAEELEALKKAEETTAQANVIPDRIRYKFPGMTYIPAGETIVGSNTGDIAEQPPHAVFVDAFYISTHEITNKEYQQFVEDTGHRAPSHWVGGRIPDGKENHPVTWVSFEDAEAYCRWKEGRLPTEAEWERAARGNQLIDFPWGNQFDNSLANTWEAGNEGTVPVGQFPEGASPYGVHDMAGNVFEWVSGFFSAYPGARVQLKEYQKHLRVLRGGSWNFNDYYARTSHRFARSGGERSRSFGFRMAKN